MVSIIIPVYNVQDYIIKCLSSVVAQTYKGVMECLVIDDCGQDDSVLLAEKFIASYNGDIDFRIIHHEHNRGLSAARNTGIKESKGEWLYLLDSDDWIIPECIQLMMECVEKHLDVEMVCAGANVSTNEHSWLDYTKKDLPSYSNDRDFLQVSMLKRYDIGMTAWNKLIKRAFVTDNNLFFEEGFVHEDEIWNFETAMYISSASFIKKNTYNYIKRPQSIITEAGDDKHWKRMFVIWERMLSKIRDIHNKTLVMGLCRFIYIETRDYLPANKKQQLFTIYIKLALKYHGCKSILYITQGFLALIGHRKYNNTKIIPRIILI